MKIGQQIIKVITEYNPSLTFTAGDQIVYNDILYYVKYEYNGSIDGLPNTSDKCEKYSDVLINDSEAVTFNNLVSSYSDIIKNIGPGGIVNRLNINDWDTLNSLKETGIYHANITFIPELEPMEYLIKVYKTDLVSGALSDDGWSGDSQLVIVQEIISITQSSVEIDPSAVPLPHRSGMYIRVYQGNEWLFKGIYLANAEEVNVINNYLTSIRTALNTFNDKVRCSAMVSIDTIGDGTISFQSLKGAQEYNFIQVFVVDANNNQQLVTLAVQNENQNSLTSVIDSGVTLTFNVGYTNGFVTLSLPSTTYKMAGALLIDIGNRYYEDNADN